MKVINIIIAEDNLEAVERIKNVLEKFSDIKILGVATNGEEEYKMIKEMEPDLVFSDIEMPLMDGLEVVDKIKKEKPNTEMQVILITGKASTDFIKDAIRLGIFDIIYKPYNDYRITEAIDKYKNYLYREELQKLRNENQIIKKETFLQKIIQSIKNLMLKRISFNNKKA